MFNCKRQTEQRYFDIKQIKYKILMDLHVLGGQVTRKKPNLRNVCV